MKEAIRYSKNIENNSITGNLEKTKHNIATATDALKTINTISGTTKKDNSDKTGRQNAEALSIYTLDSVGFPIIMENSVVAGSVMEDLMIIMPLIMNTNKKMTNKIKMGRKNKNKKRNGKKSKNNHLAQITSPCFGYHSRARTDLI